MTDEIKFIAFGAGQCSSVLPFILNDYDLIIFCDTGYELPLTYEWIDVVAKSFPTKFLRIIPPRYKDLTFCPPICTKEMKVNPTNQVLRSLGAKKAIKYLGYTVEEKKRINEKHPKWIEHKYPLIELGWTRKHCQKYLLENFGFIPPRSGCTICKNFNRQHLVNGIKKMRTLIEI